MTPAEEIQRRRTFAIISHPDAGKTTLTEKLLLYGGAVQLAGSVTARKSQRAATSDWMELERKRGISITSTVLQFDYRGFRINLLDTPGHRDFSEDTYRVLTAVDAVIMVIDAGKGIETQTRKLFEVCRQRGVPIFTFMNKMDRPTRDPLELLDELERVLGIGAYPVNWPLGTGFEFRGVFDRQAKQVHLFEKIPGGGQYMPPVSVTGLDADIVRQKLDESSYARTVEELEMLEIAGVEYREADVLAGHQTPVFFGSAMNNFGVQMLLDAFVERASPPGPRNAGEAGDIEPDRPDFSGFIFKIQANMDPRHRDRIAFLRVCSGRFDRDMQVFHSRTKKKIRLSNAHRLFAKDRETIEEAWPGDIVGLVGYHDLGIGDTLSEDPSVAYHEIPRFPPECFAFLHNPNTAKFKQFRQGLEQLLQEGVVQLFHIVGSLTKTPLLAAVGPLQFEVVQYRLESEYGAESRLESATWECARWLDPGVEPSKLKLPTGVSAAQDSAGGIALLFPNDWTQRYFRETNPGVELRELAPPG